MRQSSRTRTSYSGWPNRAVAEQSRRAESQFFVWDSTAPGYLVDQGLPRCKCPPESGFFPTEARGAPDLAWIRANAVPKYTEDPLAIDIECYGTKAEGDTYKYTSQEIGWLASVVKEFHKARPAQRVGIYMTPPERYGGCSPYSDPNHPEYKQRWADWTTRNQVMIPLAQEADIMFPSLYGLYSDMAQWERFARQNVEQTRMISQGKPVLGFIWPTWHNNAEATGPIGYDDWMIMLEVTKLCLRRHLHLGLLERTLRRQ